MELSFEFFPPKTPAGMEKLKSLAVKLQKFKPDFYSVTYGAGGSTRDRTLETVKMLQDATQVAVCPHLSCVTSKKSELEEILDCYKAMGIKHIVALRGDAPSGSGSNKDELPYAADLVQWIRSQYGTCFNIKVAAYPEVHPETNGLNNEVEFFKQKCAQGADSAITQYFFNHEAYTNFVEQAQTCGVTTPIIPGIMPIQSLEAVKRFSKMCGAEFPRWLEQSLIALQDDPDGQKRYISNCTTRLCRSLLEQGAPGLHFYTLNQEQPTLAILDQLVTARASEIV